MPTTRLAVHLTGENGEVTVNLWGPDGSRIVVTPTEQIAIGLYGSVRFFEPDAPLRLGEHRMSVTYEVNLFRNEFNTTPDTRFTVQSQVNTATVSSTAQVVWDLASHGQVERDSCGTYVEQSRLTLSANPAPLWLEIKASGAHRMGTEDPSFPTALRWFTTQPSIQFRSYFETECIRVTPQGLNGPLGQTVELCQPRLCTEVPPTEMGLPDTVNFDNGTPCADRSQALVEVPAPESSGGCVCSDSKRPWSVLMFLLLPLWGLRRRLA